MRKTLALLLLSAAFISPAAYADERNPEIPHHHQGKEPLPDDYHLHLLRRL